MRKALGAILFIATAIALPVSSSADTPGRHPLYLRARSDLRTVQWLLRVNDEPNVMRHVHAVDEETERAIQEIDRAAVLDHKDLNDHPGIDQRLDRRGRFQKAMELLKRARHDIGKEEDNPRALAWRDGAYRHIDAAMDQLRLAARDLHMDHMEGW